jgi:hypothetical protein
MPTFEIQTADGSVYEVDAINEGAALAALNMPASTRQAQSSGPAQFTADMMRKFKQGAALGFGDEASAALKAAFGGRGAEGQTFGERYQNARDYERAAYDRATDRTGLYGTAAEIAGSIAPGMAAGEVIGAVGGARAAVPALQGATRTTLPALEGAAAPAASRLASAGPLTNAMATGALTGAVQGVGDTTDIMDAPSAAAGGAVVGSLGGALGYGAGKGLERLARATNTTPRVAAAPSLDDLQAGYKDYYDRFTNAGGVFTQEGLDDLAGSIRNRLGEMGWQPELGPKVTAFNKAMDRARRGSGVPSGAESLNNVATPKQIQNLRRIASKNIAQSPDPTERAYGTAIIDEIDGFLENLRPDQYAAPPGASGSIAEDLRRANRLFSQYSKASAVEDALGQAERRAASTYSGGNENNAMRQEMRKVYERMLKRGGLTDDEKSAFETAIRGGRSENIARGVGKLAASRGGVMSLLNLGGMYANPAMMVPLSMTAEGAKYLGDRLTRRNLEEVSRVMRAGGRRRPVAPPPNAIQRGASQLPSLLSGPGGAALVRGLL